MNYAGSSRSTQGGVSPSSCLLPASALPAPYMAGLLTHQGEEPEVDEVLPPGRQWLEVNHQDISEEQEEGEVGEDVHVEDDNRCREEGSEARQAAHGLQPLLPVGSRVEVGLSCPERCHGTFSLPALVHACPGCKIYLKVMRLVYRSGKNSMHTITRQSPLSTHIFPHQTLVRKACEEGGRGALVIEATPHQSRAAGQSPTAANKEPWIWGRVHLGNPPPSTTARNPPGHPHGTQKSCSLPPMPTAGRLFSPRPQRHG